MDVLDVGNMVNANWGLIQQSNSIQPIVVSVDATRTLIYPFNDNQTESFGFYLSLALR